MKILNRDHRLGYCGALLLALTLVGAPAIAEAAELVVFSSNDCQITQKFRREVTPHYRGTKGAQVFPLRFVNIESPSVKIVLARPVTTSPTFVFVDNGKEIARFAGYPGREHFLRLINGAADAILKAKSAH